VEAEEPTNDEEEETIMVKSL